MTLLDSLVSQGVRAFREPREAAADVIALGVPRDVLVPGLMVIVILSVMLNALGEAVAPTPLASITHFQMSVFLLILFVSFAAAVFKVGQAMGGLGEWQDSLLLAIFFQAVFLPAQALQVLLIIIVPPIASLFGLAIFLFGLWVNVNFIAALHGFPSLGKALGVLVLASVVVAFVMAFAAPLIGISLFGGAPGV
ncbi:MAG: YIP1 family protein [Pseudomonadota bacterium]